MKIEGNTNNWQKGLSRKQVSERMHAGLDNTAVKPPSKSVRQIVTSNVFTYFNFVFITIAVVLILVRSYRDLTFMPLIIANTFIGIFQEIRSKILLDHLILMNVPRARVIRDGKLQRVAAEKLVRDDVVLFRAGDQIVADAIVLDGNAAVNESLLTGEADEIQKQKDAELLSGSYVVSGSVYARLTKVGEQSYINQLTLQAKKTKTKEESEIIRSLNFIVKIAGVAIIPIGAILFCQSFFINHLDIKMSVQSAVASVLGMIPEGLFLLASVSLAISAMRLGQKKVLLHNMKSIETLARVDTLCVDKTGTITSNDMTVNSIEILTNKYSDNELFTLLSDFAFSQDADNATMTAFKAHFNKPSGNKILKTQGFSSEFKYSGTKLVEGTFVLGAPEFVLRDSFADYRKQIEKHSSKGERVLVFGLYNGELNGKALKGIFEPICLVMLSNPIRENASETFKFFAEQGVDIKVISGDNPRTVSEIAKSANIKGAEKYINASTLKTQQSIDAALKSYTVFGRVTPEQKRSFIKSLQRNGHTVAMTGDGVNDILALRDADCSIAMASGSDAAAQAAQLVLLESDFSRMPEVVAEGRRVVNNLERSGSLFLVKNVFSLITSILAICFSVVYPLRPSQVCLISMFTIGIPGFLLSQMPSSKLIHGSFVENILKRAIPGGLADVFMIACALVFGNILGLNGEDTSTIATLLIATVGFLYIYSIIKPLDNYKSFTLFGCMLGLIFCTAFLPTLFSMSHMHWKAWVLFGALMVAAYLTLRFCTFAVNSIWEFVRDTHNNRSRKYKKIIN